MLSKGNLWRKKNKEWKYFAPSREMVHHETNINLSDDDENEEIDHENQSKIQHSDSDTENDDELNRTVS